MEIATATGPLSLVSGSPTDPGVMVVDDFITEEQEAQILSDLNEADNNKVPRSALPAELDDRQAWQVIVDLQRLLRGISSGSSASFQLLFVTA